MLQIFGNSAAGNIVQGLRRIFNPQGVRREEIIEEIRADPELASRVATAYRRRLTDPSVAGDAGQDIGGPLLTSIGLDPDNKENRVFLDALALQIPETFNEQIETTRVRRPGLAEEQVQAESDVSVATGAQAQATTARARNIKTEEETFGSETIRGPERTAEVRARAPEVELEFGELRNVLQTIGIEDATQQVSFWQDYNQWLRDNPKWRGLSAVGMKNPNMLNHLLGLQELSLRESLARLRANQGNLKSRAELTAEILDVFIKFNQLDEGTLKILLGDNVPEGVRNVVGNRSEMMNLLMESIFPEGASGYFTTEKSGGRGDVTGVAFRSRLAQRADGSNPSNQTEAKALGAAADEVEAAIRTAQQVVGAGEKGIDEVVAAMREQTIESLPNVSYLEYLQQRGMLGEVIDLITGAEAERVKTPEQQEIEDRDAMMRRLEGLGRPGAL